jgi:hypothetical protein
MNQNGSPTRMIPLLIALLVIAACSTSDYPQADTPDAVNGADVATGPSGMTGSDDGSPGARSDLTGNSEGSTSGSADSPNNGDASGSNPAADPSASTPRAPSTGDTPGGGDAQQNTPSSGSPTAPLIGPPPPTSSTNGGTSTAGASGPLSAPSTVAPPPTEPTSVSNNLTTVTTQPFRCSVSITPITRDARPHWQIDVVAPNRIAVWMVASTVPRLSQSVTLTEAQSRVVIPRDPMLTPVVRIYESPSMEGSQSGCNSN